jgi:undecaprenyl-diphosphatase
MEMNTVVALTAQYLIYAIVLAVAVFCLMRRGQKGNLELAIFGLLSLIFGLVLVKIAGALISDPRPFVVHHFTPLIAHAPDNGFPSDHTTLAMVLALVVLQVSRTWGVVLVIAALTLGAARVAAGVHSPIDILGAVVVAAVAVALARLDTPWALRLVNRQKATK